ncbi:glycerol-3-phosphate acyltransferase [Coprothermobacter platensis]|uniref:glycerol-3-phosphate acyltransferase n=1 Tax=Coprothermobacter platensis TaxID=108819 RepID=UPI00146168CF|nr:glycerol-3-phosphate acyltransferase [Coprothermobacter platensis]
MWRRNILYLLFCYVFGSTNTALIITRALKHEDIRVLGDGNAGATNVFMNVSNTLGILVFFIDFVKGMLPFLIGTLLSIPSSLLAVGGTLTIVGHDFPMFFSFRGGTGIASVFGGTFYLYPRMGFQLFLFMAIVYGMCYVFQVRYFNFSYLEESEAAGFIFLLLSLTNFHNELFQCYFLLCLSVIILRNREKVMEIFGGRPKRERPS